MFIVKAFDVENHEVTVAPQDLIWESDDEKLLHIAQPGVLIPQAIGQTSLTVRTKDARAILVYPEGIWPHDSFQITQDSVEKFEAQSASGHSYSELLNNWSKYNGSSVNLSGAICPQSGAGDCGECVGFAKAFGNNTPNTYATGSWYQDTALLSRGSNPRVNAGISAGDSIATMQNIGGQMKYSLSDGYGSGHVALYVSSTSSSIFVRDQNWGANARRVSAHSINIPYSNGQPYCSTTTTDDPNNICNYYKVVVR